MTHWSDGFKDASGKGPLDGIRVLDLGRYQAGPRAGLIFARLGADVIKVEPPGRGDESRSGNPKVRGQSAYWVQYNSGKRSVTLDLRSTVGKEILSDLVKQSDILIQNFRPGVIDEMGFGYDDLRSINKRIVMINVSAYGQYGPLSEQIGFDQVGQAMSGLMSLNGEPEGRPMVVPFPIVDRITALHATIGALAALRERDISGEGQAIDVCLADSAYTTVEIPVSAYLDDGQEPHRTGNEYELANMYETNDGFVYVASYGSDNIFPRLAKAIGHEDWSTDSRFDSVSSRAENNGIVQAALIGWCAAKTAEAASCELNGADIPSSPVNQISQAATHPHVTEREVMVEVEDARAGSMHVTGRVIKFSRSGMPVGPAPEIGQHTDEVLSDILGKSSDEITALRDSGAV
ncbi:MAG: CoA transferase [Chloroflexi bacterium]|nr:CoA transferase [Chloroflexota bacterium]